MYTLLPHLLGLVTCCRGRGQSCYVHPAMLAGRPPDEHCSAPAPAGGYGAAATAAAAGLFGGLWSRMPGLSYDDNERIELVRVRETC